MSHARGRLVGVAISVGVAAAALAILPLIGGALGARTAVAALPLAAERHFLPEVESAGYTTTLKSMRPAGMESFGYSTILLRNWSDAANAVGLRIANWTSDDVILGRDVAAGEAAAVPLKLEPSVAVGRYSAVLSGSGSFGALALTEWVTGAAAAWEAPEADANLILPLLVRNVYSNTSILYVQNVDESSADNKVDCTIFDNATGELQVSFTMALPPGATVSYDTWFDHNTFGRMPINTGAGGSIACLRFAAKKPLAVMAYGDEMSGDGTSAMVARPVTAASRWQYLPSVRANYLGNSLIGIANPSQTKGLDLTISYSAHDRPASGSVYSQSLHIAARGATYVDLASLQRGEGPPRGLPLGTRLNGGFLGSAVIEASEPVLAVAQEEARDGGVVKTLAAYNAFGPAELDTELSVPRVYNDRASRSTLLVIQNPGGAPADVSLAYRSTSGEALRSDSVTVAAGASHAVRVPASLPEESALDVSSSAPIAVLAYETSLLASSDWSRWGRDAMVHAALRQSEAVGPTPFVPTPTASRTSSPTLRPASPTATRSQSTPSVTASPSVDPHRFRAYLPRADRAR